MSNELYKSERITVKVAANSAAKVVISDNFTGSNATFNREAFIEMCKELGKEEQKWEPIAA
jgi:polysaccharide deacetylase 2 family uncharacterized protein YibQ